MGQQQLLLVILVTIIVGIATVVAINVFGTSAASANVDAVRNDVLTIAAASQGWYIKPEMMGGGGNSFTDMTFNDFNFSAEKIHSTTGVTAENMNGTYVLDTSSGSSFTVTAHPSSCDGYIPSASGSEPGSGTLCAADDQLVATVLPNDVSWSTN